MTYLTMTQPLAWKFRPTSQAAIPAASGVGNKTRLPRSEGQFEDVRSLYLPLIVGKLKYLLVTYQCVTGQKDWRAAKLIDCVRLCWSG